MNEIVTLLDSVDPIEKDEETTYAYNGYLVPRVTKILQKCIHSDSLMYWANSLGFKRQSYNKTLKLACDIGSQCHNNIDEFLDNNSHLMPEDCMDQSRNAYNSFLKWFYDINSYAIVDVIYHEKTLVCKYFGGTLDGLYRVNGKIYLVDYKTSNSIGFKYWLQLSAYRYMLREELGIEIDGCIILQLSKVDISYNEFVLNFNNAEHLEFINSCERTFLSLVYAYYNIAHIERQYKELQWEVV
jgi:hypothetical protein